MSFYLTYWYKNVSFIENNNWNIIESGIKHHNPTPHIEKKSQY